MRPNPFRGDQQPQLGDGPGRVTAEMRDMQSETGRLVPGNTRETGGQASAFRENNGLTTPMGEVPDLPARSGVAAVHGVADKVAAAVHAVAEIRELHQKSPLYGWADDCEICSSDDDEIREQHVAAEDASGEYVCTATVVGDTCHHCSQLGWDGGDPVSWPCPDIRILEKWGL